MTIGSNYIIKFQDLLDFATDKIKGIAKNIDKFASDVPAQYKNGQTFTLLSSTPHSLVAKVVDSSLVVVPLTTVQNELKTFLTDRGLYAKTDTVMSFKNIVNFFNNLSVFMTSKLWYIYSPHTGNRNIIFYNPNKVTYDDIENTYTAEYTGKQIPFYKPEEPYNGEVTVENVNQIKDPTKDQYESTMDGLLTSVDQLVKSIHNITNSHQVLTQLTYACSSSCSSSSSSSSCSSSSIFIAYMDI